MNKAQREQCQTIIHKHAAAAAFGNIFPIPGIGLAADAAAITTMTQALAALFGQTLSTVVAQHLGLETAAKIAKQGVKHLAKEASKLFPLIGIVVAPAVSVALIEATGWQLVHQFETSLSGPIIDVT